MRTQLAIQAQLAKDKAESSENQRLFLKVCVCVCVFIYVGVYGFMYRRAGALGSQWRKTDAL